MGRAKELWMKQQEQGWSSTGDKQVCDRCFEDYAVREFVQAHATASRCSYCGRKSTKPVAAEIDDVVEFIAEGINAEYEDPVHSVGWESAEGGWQLPTMDSWEVLSKVGLDDSNDKVVDDLREAFSQSQWVHTDPYGDLLCDSLRYTWAEFSEQVKHRTRFVFFRLTTPHKSAWESESHGILDSLVHIAQEVDLVRLIPVGTKWYRAHQHPPVERLKGAKRLGAPPRERAIHNRMSPAGIPMLHVAHDQLTAAAEIASATMHPSVLTIALFRNLRPIRILNLRDIPEIPSLFDEKRRHQRMALMFLRDFADEISRPISVAAAPYEYVPTQVMTEFFRYLFHQEDDEPLDGVAFRSSKRSGGIYYTLFFDNTSCADSATDKDAVMLLKTVKRITTPAAPPTTAHP